MARESDADVYLAPGLFPQPAMRTHPEPSAEPVVETASAPDVLVKVEGGGVIGSTLEELGAALAESRVGIRDAVSGMRARAAKAWVKWQQQRAEAAQALRLARERREMEREERRRQHEAELQRRAEEHQQLLAERERLAAEQERALREQMARDAALRAERERVEREAMAREAAHRAEIAHAEEQEAQRAAALAAERVRLRGEEAERIRVQREEEGAAALASERREPEPPRHLENPALPPPAEVCTPAAELVYADAAPGLHPRLVHRRRRIPSARERQWQRAAFLASIVTLAAMLGFALAANMRPKSPLPASLIQNEAQQQVPFGPAKMDVSSAGRPAKVAPPLSRPGKPALSAVEGARQGGGVPTQAAPPRASQKPSPAKPAPPRRARRVSRESDIVAEDEVIVRHAPTSHAQRAQAQRATPGVRRISDEN
jgi:hypothetical protein